MTSGRAITSNLMKASMPLLRFWRRFFLFGGASAALTADAANGEHLAEMRCITCHPASTGQRRDVTDAPPFLAIARKFASNPGMLAFSLFDPHPRMNVTLTRREAEDIAAYIDTFAK
jgi:cytochrome c